MPHQQQARRRGGRAPCRDRLADAAAAPPRGRRRQRPASRPSLIFALLPGAGALYSLQGSMTFLTLSAELGIIATAAALLIIGGEFDLSVGSMIGFAGVVDRARRHATSDLPLWGGILAAFAAAVVVGYFNGLDRGADPAALLHRHAGLALHPARPLDRGDPRSSPAARRSPTSSTTSPTRRRRALFNGEVLTGLFHWMGEHGLDRHPQRRHAVRRRASRCRSSGGSRSPRSRAGC